MYCSVYDVAQVLGVKVDRFDENSWPAKETVSMLIKSNMDFIDRYTNSAWRERKRWEDPDAGSQGYEYHRIQARSWFGYSWLGNQIVLKKRKVRQLNPSLGDSMQVWNGRDWEEWLGVRNEGYSGDFWVDYDNGVVYLRRIFWYGGWYGHTFRIKYRYGGGVVPQDIRLACAYLTAINLVEGSDYNVLLPEGVGNIVNAPNKVEYWRRQAFEILELYRGVVVLD